MLLYNRFRYLQGFERIRLEMTRSDILEVPWIASLTKWRHNVKPYSDVVLSRRGVGILVVMLYIPRPLYNMGTFDEIVDCTWSPLPEQLHHLHFDWLNHLAFPLTVDWQFSSSFYHIIPKISSMRIVQGCCDWHTWSFLICFAFSEFDSMRSWCFFFSFSKSLVNSNQWLKLAFFKGWIGCIPTHLFRTASKRSVRVRSIN